ncbi:MAG TPA: hypothetical protein VK524_17505 [Polyangiaceae bacterium]|nr:hypothetical protein [Polyangiaceae bacterium]
MPRARRELVRDTRGAALVVGIVMGVLLVGGLWHIASIGDAIIWRERAQDAADAGAFENAVWQARGMNVIVSLNIIMALILSILVMWRIVMVLLALGLIVAILFCLIGIGCPAIPPITNALQFMIRNDRRVANTVLRVVTGFRAVEVVVASATPIIAARQSSVNASRAYAMGSDDGNVTALSASLLPAVSPGEISESASCLVGAITGAVPITPSYGRGYELGRNFLGQPRMGVGVSLPVQFDDYSKLCEKAGQSVFENLAGLMEQLGLPGAVIEGLETGRDLAGSVTGNLPGLFCQPFSFPPRALLRLFSIAASVQCLAEGKNPLRLPRCMKKKEREARKKLEEAWTTKDQHERFVKCARPAKVWEYAANGNVFMRSFSWADPDDPLTARDDRGLSVADLSRLGGAAPAGTTTLSSSLRAAETPLIWANAEIYFDCNARWVPRRGERTNCKDDAMWQIRWKARLRRMLPLTRLAASAIEPVFVATLARALEGSIEGVFGAIGGAIPPNSTLEKLTRQLRILVPSISDTRILEALRDSVEARLYQRTNFEGVGAFIARHAAKYAVIH